MDQIMEHKFMWRLTINVPINIILVILSMTLSEY